MVKVSVIVPVYNVAAYLRQCVDSILNQTYQDIEILLINDRSTDTSEQICLDYQQHDSRVRVIDLPLNLGIANVRNLGICNSRGEYILFVDSDDWINEDFVEKYIELAETNGAEIVMGPYYQFDMEKQNFLLFDPLYETQELSLKQYLVERSSLRAVQFVTIHGKLIKKELFDRMDNHRGNWFPAGRVAEDQAVVHRLFMKANKSWYCKEAMYCWRITPNSITRSEITEKYVEDDLMARSQYLIDLLLTESDTSVAIKAFRWFLTDRRNSLIDAGLQDTVIFQEIDNFLKLTTD